MPEPDYRIPDEPQGLIAVPELEAAGGMLRQNTDARLRGRGAGPREILTGYGSSTSRSLPCIDTVKAPTLSAGFGPTHWPLVTL